MIKKITVCQGEGSNHFIRLDLSAPPYVEVVRFQTAEEFTKPEADYRAMNLSSRHGFDRDQLPTHQKLEAYPKDKEWVGDEH